jgi:hypothetical protein
MSQEYLLKIEDGLYDIGRNRVAYKDGSGRNRFSLKDGAPWVVISISLRDLLSSKDRRISSNPMCYMSINNLVGGDVYFDDFDESIEWACRFGRRYKTLEEAMES